MNYSDFNGNVFTETHKKIDLYSYLRLILDTKIYFDLSNNDWGDEIINDITINELENKIIISNSRRKYGKNRNYVLSDKQHLILYQLHEPICLMFSQNPEKFEKFCEKLPKFKHTMHDYMIEFYESIYNTVTGNYIIK